MRYPTHPVARAVLGSLFSAGLLSACYTYRPVEIADLAPQLEVRARVTGAESDRLSEILGSDDRVIEGTIEEIDANNLLLLVPVVSAFDRTRGGALSQRINVARSGVVEVELKQLDRARTGVMFGAITAVIGALVLRQLNQDQGGGDNPVPPPPPEDGVLRFPIRLRWGGI